MKVSCAPLRRSAEVHAAPRRRRSRLPRLRCLVCRGALSRIGGNCPGLTAVKVAGQQAWMLTTKLDKRRPDREDRAGNTVRGSRWRPCRQELTPWRSSFPSLRSARSAGVSLLSKRTHAATCFGCSNWPPDFTHVALLWCNAVRQARYLNSRRSLSPNSDKQEVLCRRRGSICWLAVRRGGSTIVALGATRLLRGGHVQEGQQSRRVLSPFVTGRHRFADRRVSIVLERRWLSWRRSSRRRGSVRVRANRTAVSAPVRAMLKNSPPGRARAEPVLPVR